MKHLTLTIVLLFLSISAFSQKYVFSGKVLIKGTNDPVEFATVVMTDKELWAVANEKGEFVIKGVSKGKTKVEISCLGYASRDFEIDVTKDITNTKFYLEEDDLTLTSAVVTAKENVNSATTSRTIDRTALEHMQVVSVADITSLLPGGQSLKSSNLTDGALQRIEIRSNEKSLSSFGTAVEVDGIRLSNNSSFSETQGASTKNVASSNVESIEVITGVPSVEHGDMTNGIVKINTKKGKTPLMATISMSPNTKQYSISKGIDLGGKTGVLNISAERTKSIAQLASPYTTYDRNNLSAIYSNTFMSGDQPVKFSAGVTGNLGGYNDMADPDAFKDTYKKVKDNTIRGNFSLNWLLNKQWITNVELTGSIVYSNQMSTENTNKSSAGSTSSLHGMTEGYFVSTPYSVNPDAEVILRPAGYWYEKKFVDNKPLDYNIHLKVNWAHDFGSIINKVKLGINYTGSGNLGEGAYYEDLSLAPDWRPYPYNEVPFINNIAAYAEDNITIPIGTTSLNLIGGIRSEWTMINNSGYGTVNSLSPRFNAKYNIFRYNKSRVLRELSARASWGVAVKLPSFSVLYPAPSYYQVQVFAPATTADGSAYYAYYILPKTIEYNPDLRWQKGQQSEIGIEADVAGVKVSLSAYYNKTLNAYTSLQTYTPFTYKWTDQRNLESCPIPSANRIYEIDQKSGVVTVKDKTGAIADRILEYKDKNMFVSQTTMVNEPIPAVRKGIEWVIDFGQIKPIMTSIRIDGTYYHYRGYSEVINSNYPNAVTMSDGVTPYQYVGYYVGSDNMTSNGSESARVRNNVTFTTHIPKARLIFSLRVESALYTYTHNISEYSGGQIVYPIGKDNNLPIGTEFNDIYTFAAKYPLYYSTFSDPDTKIPFLEKFIWAKDNDPKLFSELNQLVKKTSSNYYFRGNVISPYFSASISVTKEIGKIASLSFYANNFFNTTAKYHSSQADLETSLFYSEYIPRFYYGLTLRLKI
ncbi:MAG: TonB-dependent receptor [Bacteroidales bacterium]|nr:TonB-dependent receptor [Bacteroidales bacterium]MDD4669423.1 TonB-dependent receptor [Bacteroidales bacterium]